MARQAFKRCARPDAAAASEDKAWHNGVLISVEAHGWTSASIRSAGAGYYERVDADVAANSATVEAAEAEADGVTEVAIDAIMDSLAASGIFVPLLDPRSKQRPDGAALLQHSTYCSAWVASLRVPSTAGYTAGDGSKAQHMLIKTSCFYSEQRATKALAAAARRGRAVYVPMERDAMHEVRAAVKASLARASASVLAASSFGASSSSSGALPNVLGGALGQPVHVEVRPCSQRSSSGPDFEVVAVYPYHPAGDDATGFLAVNEAAPTAQQQRIQAWLHDSE
ncbi:hypothetical protein PLESTB_000602900 [Pleodorina starrii]|uniref:Uncharacterized protein n=1 Tax=Pleodorina starrii TaxID=330485 RepID=A0A9W6BIX8_9CHLO|nr:hypothetical protein PLESTM_000423800 [Pleodorina starrii]GLC52266.1 hypothetical protein PLESTB_000602900 [Pleodorina starrii]GLC77428.1 hypothetical protein PLESTF_001934900 [Pleodorina starrii]